MATTIVLYHICSYCRLGARDQTVGRVVTRSRMGCSRRRPLQRRYGTTAGNVGRADIFQRRSERPRWTLAFPSIRAGISSDPRSRSVSPQTAARILDSGGRDDSRWRDTECRPVAVRRCNSGVVGLTVLFTWRLSGLFEAAIAGWVGLRIPALMGTHAANNVATDPFLVLFGFSAVYCLVKSFSWNTPRLDSRRARSRR